MKLNLKEADSFKDHGYKQVWKWQGRDYGGIKASFQYIENEGGYYGEKCLYVHRVGGRPCIMHRVERQGDTIIVACSSYGQQIG